MNIYIGLLQQDGIVRYVTTFEGNNQRLPSILKTFYPNESRTAALIDLGNLCFVGPTPYGKSNRYTDKVHCRAHIRDEREKKGKHQPRYADTETAFAELDGYKFLFRNGKWWHAEKDRFTAGLPHDFENKKLSSLFGLELTILNSDGKICHHTNPHTESWKELEQRAANDNATYFLFRNNRLVATINHPLNR